MKKEKGVFRWLSEDLPGEAFPGQCITEILGDHRVLIENHYGVTQYSKSQIGVNVKFGQLMICGCGLELLKMNKEQLVITGRIDTVSLIRRH